MGDPEFPPPPLESCPGSVEMERIESKPDQAPPVESLRSKLQAHYQKRMKKRNVLSSPLTPECVNRIAVPLYLFTVISTLKIGVLDVMPLIYAGQDRIIFLQQVLVVFIFSEMMMNWFGIRYVDSSYQRYLRVHGDVKQAGVPQTGNVLTKQTIASDSSSAVLMPLNTVPRELNETIKEHNNNADDSNVSVGTGLKSPGEIVRDATADLSKEADKANQEMDRRNEQMNSRSIVDLINISSSSQFRTDHDVKVSSGETKFDSSIKSPTPVITRQGNTVTKTYPYWSWAPCYDCGRTRPPRCHHCPLCQGCILKRDHHCFFAGSCVGYRNHRFFFIFLLWAWVGCVYATLHGFPYIGIYLWAEMSYFDVLFPVAIARFIFGYISFQTALSVTTLTLLLYFDMLTTTFIYAQSHLISWGITSFEKVSLRKSLEIKDTRSLRQKIRAVFGRYWGLSIVLPTLFFLEPEENPVHWPDIQVLKH